MAKQLQRVLVRSPNWIGDQILAFPFFYYLRQAFPEAHITAACVPWVQSLQYRNLVNEVFVLSRPEKSGLVSRFQALEQSAERLRKLESWDLGICLPPSFSSAWVLARSKVRTRRGFTGDVRSFLLNQKIPFKVTEGLHRSEEYLKLLPEGVTIQKAAQEFWGVPADNPLDEGIPSVIPEFDAVSAWPDSNPINPPSGPYWVLAPGSVAESRRWPEAQFVALARKMAQATNWTGIIVGGPAESKIAKDLAEDPLLRLLDWTARGTVASYWKVFQNARISVCNDSGLAHMAALCGSRVHIIWGAGRVPKTQPLGPGMVKLSVNPVECWPCEQNECLRTMGPKYECLTGIFPESVWEEISSVISTK